MKDAKQGRAYRSILFSLPAPLKKALRITEVLFSFLGKIKMRLKITSPAMDYFFKKTSSTNPGHYPECWILEVFHRE